MGLLTDIEKAAANPKTPVADLLRQCQILAARLRHERFREWVSHELNGYDTTEGLPSYRGPFQGEVKANLIGFRGQANNVSVPLSNLPDFMRDTVQNINFLQGVGELAEMIKHSERTNNAGVGYRLPAEAAALTPVWQGFNTIDLWVETSVTIISGILEQVRNRALEFALEIENENPNAGDVAGTDPPVPLARTNTIFQTVIHGGNVAVGPGAQVQVVQGDLGSLMRYLESSGIEAADRRELEDAIRADNHTLGHRVKGWLGTIVVKGAQSGGRIAEHLVTAAVMAYFGLK